MSGNVGSYTPELSDVIKAIVDQMMLQVFVCLPAKIVTYYPAQQYADVQIQLLKKYTDQSTEPHPVLPKVPVKQIRANGGKIRIHVPLQPGDDVLLVFSQRSIDNWKTQNKPIQGGAGGVDTKDTRTHDINDAFALIGGSSIADAFPVSNPADIEIVNDQAMISVQPSGTFKVKNSSNELLDLLDQITGQLQELADTLSTDTVNTAIGEMPLNAFSIYQDISTEVSQLQTKLETLKGS